MEKGYKDAYALKGGWDDWKESGYPTDQKWNW